MAASNEKKRAQLSLDKRCEAARFQAAEYADVYAHCCEHHREGTVSADVVEEAREKMEEATAEWERLKALVDRRATD